jgi:hypothetical protein
VKVRRRLLFVNKKKQKNFVKLDRAGFSATGPVSKKFLRRFFQKAAAFLFPIAPGAVFPLAANTLYFVHENFRPRSVAGAQRRFP